MSVEQRYSKYPRIVCDYYIDKQSSWKTIGELYRWWVEWESITEKLRRYFNDRHGVGTGTSIRSK